MSSLKDKIGMAVESAKAIATNVIHGEQVMEEPAIVAERVATCEACPDLTKLGAMKLCSICSCSIFAKTKFKDVTCPKGRWTK